MRNAAVVFTFILPLLSGSGGAAAEDLVTSDQKSAAEAITQERLRAPIRFLASDLLEGRGPATRGDALAELYIQSALEQMGIKPGAPGGGWIQKVPLVGITPTFTAPAAFRSARGTATGIHGDNFVAMPGVQKPQAKIEEAEVVFVGYGIVAPEYKWDDFKGADLKGKVLLVMNNDPEGSPQEPGLFAGKTRLWYGRWDYKYAMAAKMGAVGAIIIHTTPSAGYGWQVIQTSNTGEKFELPDDGSPRVQMRMWATEALGRKLAELGGKNLDQLRAAAESRTFRPVPLGVAMSLQSTNAIAKKESGNVIGMIPGSDPKRATEAVIYTAHHDHLGIKEGVKEGDAIYNGALDNASGVSAILAVAQAHAALKTPVARTVYFAFVAAEEQGLLGSEFLARQPPVPAGKIAANINIDGIGFFGKTRDLSMVGLGKSSIDQELAALVAMQGRRLEPDQFPDHGSFYRSDQFNFARVGVPAAYIKKGTDVIGKPAGFGREQVASYEKTDYHQPSDDFREGWDFSGAVEDVRLSFWLGCRIAQASEMPRWNPGDEFEAVRKKALAH
ncbi:MAG: M28 family peptidase [Thermoanaerobaculia bacterium]